MPNPARKIWLLIAIVFAICLTCLTLSSFVTDPAHSLPTLYGDGIENVYTYLYQSMYGKGYWFQGMNYPYGEHVFYIDGHPLVSVLLAAMGHVTAGTGLTILWWLIGLGFVLAVLYTYKILLQFGVASPMAVVYAGLVTVMSPQLFRLEGGHFAFAYLCVIPMLFYWTIRYHQSSFVKYCLYIGVLGFVGALIHLYYAPLLLVWCGTYIAGYALLVRRSLREKLKHIALLAAVVCIVVVAIKGIIALTDPVKDRPQTPYGLYGTAIDAYDIFTSVHSPVWRSLRDHSIVKGVSGNIHDNTEGYGYLGLAAMLLFIISVIAGIANRLRKNGEAIVVSESKFSSVWLFMAFGTYVFLLVMPRVWQVPMLADHLSLLRQFRTIGRFSWISYYIITIYTVVVLSRYSARLFARRMAPAAWALLLLFGGLWCVEAGGYIVRTRFVAAGARGNYEKFFSTADTSWPAFLRQHDHQAGDFQAVIMLEFFHLGSEKLWIGDPGTSATLGTQASMQLGLPLVDTRLGRTSLSQTRKQVQILAGPYADKPILRDIHSAKPFLLVVYDHVTLNADEQYLLEASDLIGQHNLCHVYACYPSRLAANRKKNEAVIANILPGMKAADTAISLSATWYVDHMDKGSAGPRLFGAGAAKPIAASDTIIATIPIAPASDSQQFELSCWFLLSDKDYNSPVIFLEPLDSAGNVIGYAELQTKYSVDNFDMWFRGAVLFKPGSKCDAVRCRLSRGTSLSYLAMDEILLRPVDALIVSKDADGRVMVNNHVFVTGEGHR